MKFIITFFTSLRQLFISYETHDEGLKIYDFIWEKFRSKNSENRQKALFWLQVVWLTLLGWERGERGEGKGE